MPLEMGTSGASRGSFTGVRGDPAQLVALLTASTASTGFPNGPCRAISSVSSALISFMDHAGSTIDNFPIRAFDNPIGIARLYSVSGSTAIFGLY